MVIDFPKPLFTIAQRRENNLYHLLELNALEFYDKIGVELSEDQLEQLAYCLEDILEETTC